MAHLRGMYDDFAGHRTPDDSEVASALRSATVAVDTNVLLDLYRFSDATREAMLEVLVGLGERLFVPHQVMREFWRNRLDVVAGRDRASVETSERIERHLGATAMAVRAWATPAGVAEPARDELLDRIAALRDELQAAVAAQLPLRVDPRGPADPVLDRLRRCWPIGSGLPRRRTSGRRRSAGATTGRSSGSHPATSMPRRPTRGSRRAAPGTT
jgi:hypothetical protein